MISARATRGRFAELEAYLPFVMDRVKETLLRFADSRGYAVVGRFKKIDSLSEKLESGRYPTWSSIDDLVAFTIVIPKISDEAEVLDFLRKAFNEVTTTERGGTKKAPDVFRFESTRFIGKLSRPEDIPGSEPAYAVLFEIQIRTAFEHAWSVTTHGLTYKNGKVSWERLRLAAQLKAAVEQLDLLVAAFEDNAKFVPQSPWPETDANETATLYFQQLFHEGKLPAELEPKDWTRFAENLSAMLRSSDSLRHKSPEERVKIALGALSKALASEIAVPMSLSLIQFIFGVLVTSGLLYGPLKNYVPLITDEMELLYPMVKVIQVRFDFNS
jgi:ppGpp synthetase/RelA/SpoT-type nucleotidyltranferase